MKARPLAALLLVACQRVPEVDALSADPARLHALRERCQAQIDDVLCRRVAAADLQRFLSGEAGADEYRTLAELPAIPASFDTPLAPAENTP